MRLVIYKTLCSPLGRAALHTGCGGLPGRGDPISAQEAPGRSHTFTSHSRGNGTGCGQAAGHSQGLRNGRNSEPGQGAARAMHLSQRFGPAAKPRLLRPAAAPGSPRGRNAWRRRKKAPPAAEHPTVQQEESREPGRFRAPLRGSSEPEPLVAETPLHTEGQTFLSSLIIFNSQPVADSQR